MTNPTKTTETPIASEGVETKRDLPPAAQRALQEAKARRVAADQAAGEAAQQPREYHGRGGLEPVRYGDWEVKGIASDF